MTTLKSKSLFSHISCFLTFCTMDHPLLEMSSSLGICIPPTYLTIPCIFDPGSLSYSHILKTWFSWRLNPRTLVSPLLQACPQEADPITQIKPSPLHRRCPISTSNLDFSHKGQSHNSSYLLGISTWRPCHYNKVKLKFTLQNPVLVGPGS